jgi:hypothetical protein
VGGLHVDGVHAVLAHQPADLVGSLVQLPDRFPALPLVVLPGSILWGASFPLALAAVAGPGQDTGRLVGGVYAANTVGAIVGSVLSGLLLVTWLGTHTSMQVLIVVSAISD